MTIETGPETTRGLLQARIFVGAPSWQSIRYQGAVQPKLLRFEVTCETEARPLYLAAVISRDEKMAWQSFQDLLGRAVELAQGGMTGIFGLEVLSVDIQSGVRHFNAPEFSQLLINHSKGHTAEFKILIRYGQLFCLLHKRVPADWGKVELKTHVEIVDPGKIRAELFVKKILRESGQEPGAIYWIHDLSANPLWDLSKEEAGLQNAEDSARKIPEVYYVHASLKAAQRLVPA